MLSLSLITAAIVAVDAFGGTAFTYASGTSCFSCHTGGTTSSTDYRDFNDAYHHVGDDWEVDYIDAGGTIGAVSKSSSSPTHLGASNSYRYSKCVAIGPTYSNGNGFHCDTTRQP
jgi:hypothetical protein